jgi:phage anti-repressor protein
LQLERRDSDACRIISLEKNYRGVFMQKSLELKIIKRNKIECVSARELHNRLEIETPFRKWFPRMVEYGFLEKEDYLCYRTKMSATKNQHTDEIKEIEIDDYAITIDMAKQICMLQRTEQGKQYRQYFLEIEKLIKEQGTVEYQKERQKSIEVRKEFTDFLKDRGYSKPCEYIQTTMQMKKVFGIKNRKGLMTKIELAEIEASEALSRVLMDDEYGYREVNPVCVEASNIVHNAKRQKIGA